MTEQNIKILSSIFKSFSDQKNKIDKEQMKFNEILIEFVNFNSLRIRVTTTLVDSILADYSMESEKIKRENKTQSILFNPLSFFSIGETMHSFLIANLIDPNAEHGQGNLFLKSFLKLLDIEVSENDNWIVTAEKGRIDILIKRIHPHSVVIIENKSNFAGDQENQLYRYWYQEIYLPNFKKFGNKTVEQITNNNNYQVIYLTPAEWKNPSDNTMKKPIGYDNSLPPSIPITPKKWLFKIEIVNWLSNSAEQLHKDNHRLREYIKQYIELWT